MKTFTMTPRDLSLDDSWDVIVLGGGPAGCAAAIAAAREGARTLLIESTGCLGGMGTSGLVPAWCPFTDQEKIIYRGLAERVFNAARDGVAHLNPQWLDWVPIDPERLKRVYDDLVGEAGVTVLFNTLLCSVEMAEPGVVSTIIAANKAGLSAYRAKVYVDGTGDADLAAWAGADFLQGDENHGELQPATHCFILSNVDDYAYQYGGNLHGGNPNSPVHAMARDARFPLIRDTHLCSNLVGPGTVGFNAGHLWEVDNTDPASVSTALIQGRKLAQQFRDALAEYHPKAFANAHLAATASLMGVRETRRIVGDYLLTVDDYLARRSFADEIGRNSYYIDIHQAKSEVKAVVDGDFVADFRYEHYGPGESHGIPYRCLTPKSLHNVLVAGRSISCDRITQGSIRVMPTCLVTGEAAGLAAALAAQQSEVDVHAVNVAQLRTCLLHAGAYLPDFDTATAC